MREGRGGEGMGLHGCHEIVTEPNSQVEGAEGWGLGGGGLGGETGNWMETKCQI